MSTDIPVLEARSVSKAFGDTRVFDNLSLTVRPGEVLVVRGANGSGKSTLLRCLIGADYFDTGDVLLHGVPFDPRVPSIRSAVAAGLGGGDRFLDLTVREHLEFTARAHGDGDPEALIDSVLADLGLAGVADRFPFALSQGQRRRLGLAACFVRPRKLLVLDEPEQNLDPRGRDWVAEKLGAERDSGIGVLLATHDQALIDRVADAELVLEFDQDEDSPA